MKRIYIAATRQDVGKTTVSLGLVLRSREKFTNFGFMKPVGQRYVEVEGHRIDEDVVLMKPYCTKDAELSKMSPITVGRYFTRNYLDHVDPSENEQHILESFRHLSRNVDLMIIEGTGHAGVGSVFDLSNARVAQLLDAEVVLVSEAGIGNALDEIALNKALFDQYGVKIIGVIINKTIPEKMEAIQKYVSKALTRMQMPLLGVIPYSQFLTGPMMDQVLACLKGSLLHGREYLDRHVNWLMIGAMLPCNMLSHFRKDTLVITPGDRTDIIFTCLSGYHLRLPFTISGMILTGGLRPPQKVMDIICQHKIPVVISEEDTYKTTERVYNCRVKIRAKDSEKIKTVRKLVGKYVNYEKIMELA